MPDATSKSPAPLSSRKVVDAFLNEARAVDAARAAGGRLIFALDATASRQPTWDLARSLQREMFAMTTERGGLAVQLVYFRGLFECRASRFVASAQALDGFMRRIHCESGSTQIAKVLRHARNEAKDAPVGALVFIGDSMEENPEQLYAIAGELGLRGVKAFLFQEGQNLMVKRVFEQIARLTGGACAAFDPGAPGRLRELLGAAAAYAAGGLPELERRAREGGEGARLLLSRMR